LPGDGSPSQLERNPVEWQCEEERSAWSRPRDRVAGPF